MSTLDVQNLSKSFAGEVILEGVSFTVERGEKVGLIGANGSGKTTILKLVMGLEIAEDGAIAKARGVKLGYLPQQAEHRPDSTVKDELLRVFDTIRELEGELAALESSMADSGPRGESSKTLAETDHYGRLLEEFEQLGGYSYEYKINTVAEGLGLTRLLDRQIDTLSGGEKNIVALARVLLDEPDILLLDEPGNHLDFEGLAWLEKFLRASPNSTIIVSHDRYLLDRVVDRILEIEDNRVTGYHGNYSAYRAEKLKFILNQKAAFSAQQKEIKRLEEMIKRFELWARIVDNPRHAVQARNKQKMLDRMERIKRPDLDGKRIEPRFQINHRSGNVTLELNRYSRSFGENVLFHETDLLLSFGDRVGLVGPNGSGKSTLFKDIVADAGWENPRVRIGPRTKVGYYSQEHETLTPERTILDEVCIEGRLTREKGFGVLSRFLFRWENMNQKVETLSGGEKSRIQLAKIVISGSNLLLLDEPTNHLDVYSREKVEEEFEGSLFIISHDRYFLNRIIDRIVELRDRRFVEYPGDFSYYWEELKRADSKSKPSRHRLPGAGSKRRRSTSQLKNSRQVEVRIEQLEADKLHLEEQMEEAYRKSAYKKGAQLVDRLQKLEKEIAVLYEQLS